MAAQTEPFPRHDLSLTSDQQPVGDFTSDVRHHLGASTPPSAADIERILEIIGDRLDLEASASTEASSLMQAAAFRTFQQFVQMGLAMPDGPALRHLLDLALAWLQSTVDQRVVLNPPEVALTRDGELHISWQHNQQRFLDLTVDADGVEFEASWFGHDGSLREQTGNLDLSLARTKRTIRWLVRGRAG